MSVPTLLLREGLSLLRVNLELVYDPGCPNVDAARNVLAVALQDLDLPAVWREWSTDDPECPATHRKYGSPTILLNGSDIAPGPHPWVSRDEEAGPRCRIYVADGGEETGAPPLATVTEALREATGPDVV